MAELNKIQWVSHPAGCRMCRVRHIKCDKTEPECKQCQRYGRPCPGPAKIDANLLKHPRKHQGSTARGSKWIKTKRVDIRDTRDENAQYWEEASRREIWDRGYTRRLRLCKIQPDNIDAINTLNEEYHHEQASRREWDRKHRQTASASSSVQGASASDLSTGSLADSFKPKPL